jgi:hypothetical protein
LDLTFSNCDFDTFGAIGAIDKQLQIITR